MVLTRQKAALKTLKKRKWDWPQKNSLIKIETILDKNEKYGRILARVWNEAGECLNTEIVKAGLAREYFGVGDKTFKEFKKA
jgi:endonuclease YncB( thermonuclease family)